jgi:ADP-dependent NAD(P)H-hydrate dehydratase / NAD(P)H-hydrate epimerase
MGGAARLAARGALRVGAGLVTLGCPLPALAENAARMDTVMLRPLHDGRALARMLDDQRYNALCLGPGMGFERARDMVPVATRSARGVVVDADALSAYGPDPGALFALCAPNVVLTPHGGEFRRLFPDLAERVAGDPDGVLRLAARRSGAVVLLKGARTVIAAPDGAVAVSDATGARAAPWLATAGSGDVLAGVITGLLARGFPAFDAARLGTWLHVEAARSFGPGLIAEDLPEALPGVFRALGL